MVLWLLFFLLLSGLAWLLWAPLRLEIDSNRGVYRLVWAPLAAATWLPDKGLDVMEARLLFFRKKIALSKIGKRRPEPAKPPQMAPKPRSGVQKRSRFSLRQIRTLAMELLKTFRVRRCRVWWDSDDFVLNAGLFPVAYFLKSDAVRVSINFQGRRDLVLFVENRLGRILWVIIKSLIFNKKLQS